MKKISLLLLMLLITAQIGNCSLLNKEINIFNLKSDSMYILDVDSSVKNINISNKNIVNIIPITSILNDKKQLFVEAKKDGVCDVVLTTDTDVYQIRFIAGPNFQDDKVGLTEVDIPSKYNYGTK